MTTAALANRLDRIIPKVELRVAVIEEGETIEQALMRTGLPLKNTIFVHTGVTRSPGGIG